MGGRGQNITRSDYSKFKVSRSMGLKKDGKGNYKTPDKLEIFREGRKTGTHFYDKEKGTERTLFTNRQKGTVKIIQEFLNRLPSQESVKRDAKLLRRTQKSIRERNVKTRAIKSEYRMRRAVELVVTNSAVVTGKAYYGTRTTGVTYSKGGGKLRKLRKR